VAVTQRSASASSSLASQPPQLAAIAPAEVATEVVDRLEPKFESVLAIATLAVRGGGSQTCCRTCCAQAPSCMFRFHLKDPGHVV
jgi:hypothetical protein